jgi:hypothetical protein
MLIGWWHGLHRLSKMTGNPLPVCQKVLPKVKLERGIEKMARRRKAALMNKKKGT